MSEYGKHVFQLLTDPYNDQVEIDIEIVPLIRALWALGLETMNSCQDNHGYIWIEFPPDHAQVFMNTVRDNCDEALRWRISRAISEHPQFARKYFESINDLPDTWLVDVCTNCPDSDVAVSLSVCVRFPREHLTRVMAVLASVYGSPIRSEAHKEFCLRTAARRYGGLVIREGEMYFVEDEDGVCHTDEVLRAASFFE